jgi:putative peptidoglycan lipid II flippase
MAGLTSGADREPLFQRGQTLCRNPRDSGGLLFYSVGIWSIVGVRVITSTFYSMQDTRTPVKIAAVGVAANLILSLALMGPLKHSGLALANSLASGINFLMLSFFLRRKLHRIDARKIAKSFLQVVLSSSLMGLTGWLLLRGELWTRNGSTAIKAVYLSGTMVVCIVMYAAANSLMKNEELQYVREMIAKKFSKR